jgi:manganese-dependent inorganic pyrophosphatase
MLSAVLSDTLNFKSPTTTDRDRAVAARLAAQLEVPSMDGLATLLFDAKSGELAGMSAREIIEADIKEFSFGDAAGRVHSPLGIAVVETTSVTPVLARTEELLAEVRRLKQERSLRVLLLAIVDIVRLETLLLLADADDASLATRAFPDGQGSEGEGCDQHVASACSHQVLAIGAKVSRKLDIVPPVQRTIKRGWVPS